MADKSKLRQEFERFYGSKASASLSAEFMQKALDYHAQEQQNKGIKKTVKSKITRLINQLTNGNSRLNIPTEIKSGTRLIRQYQGNKYEVVTTEEGFEFDGEIYKSLSAIARKITGTRWNGKLFFGLKK